MNGPGWKGSTTLPASVRLAWHEAEPAPRDVAIADLYTRLDFPSPPGPLPYLVANMVMTLNGEATVGGKAATIGTPVDSLVLTRLRAAADAVLTGSGTLRAEDATAALPETEAARRVASGRSPRLLAVLLASDLSWSPEMFSRRFFTDARFDKLVVTADRPDAEDVRRMEDRGIAVARVPAGQDGRPDVTEALRTLRTRGARVVVSEGGPHVFASLLRARMVHEYFQTTAPFATGDPAAIRPIMGDVTSSGRPLLLSRVSRYEHTFQDPGSGVRLVEAYDRFRVIYPS